MQRIVILVAIALLVAAGGAGWYFYGGGASAFTLDEAPPAAFVPGTPPLYVPLGIMQVPVFDGGAHAGNLVFEATLMVPDERAKLAVGSRMVAVRDAFLRDLSDVAVLVALTGKAVVIDRLKPRLSATAGRVLGPDQPFELLIQNYSYSPVV